MATQTVVLNHAKKLKGAQQSFDASQLETSVSFRQLNQSHPQAKTVLSDLLRESLQLHKPSTPFDLSSKELKSIVYTQACFRGARVRKEMELSWPDAFQFTKLATNAIFTNIVKIYNGITRLFLHLGLLTLILVMVHFQVFAQLPSASELELPFIQMLERIQVGESGSLPEYISTIEEVWQYFHAAIEELHQVDALHNQTDCSPIYESVCEKLQQGIYTTEHTPCYELSESSGFMSTHSRGFLTMFLSQNRRYPVECTSRPSLNSYGISEKGDSRSCFSEDLTNTFESEYFLQNPNEFDMIQNESFVTSKQDKIFTAHITPGLYNVEKKVSHCFLDYLQHINWLDERTNRVCLSMMMSNRNLDGAFVTAEACFVIPLGGSIDFYISTNVSHMFLVQDQIPAICLFVIYCCVILHQTKILVTRIVKDCTKDPSWEKFVESLNQSHTLLLMFDSMLNIIHYVCIGYYIKLLVDTSNFDSSEINTSLFYSGSHVDNLVAEAFKLTDIINTTRIYKDICAIVIYCMILQSFRFLNFHPEFGVISRTLKEAFRDLVHFAIVFATVLVMYAYVSMLLIGESDDAYRTLKLAFNEVMFIAVGELEEAKYSFFEAESGVPGQFLFNALFFWSLILLATLLLMNIFLSLVIDAFVTVQNRKITQKHFDTGVCFSIWYQMTLMDLNLKFWRSGSTFTEVMGTSLSFYYEDVPSNYFETWSVDKYHSTVGWLNTIKERSQETKPSSFLIRKTLEQVYSIGVTEHIINSLRHVSMLDRSLSKEAKNGIYKRTAEDMEFKNFSMLTALYQEQIIHPILVQNSNSSHD